jgi:hypothetical protein
MNCVWDMHWHFIRDYPPTHHISHWPTVSEPEDSAVMVTKVSYWHGSEPLSSISNCSDFVLPDSDSLLSSSWSPTFPRTWALIVQQSLHSHTTYSVVSIIRADRGGGDARIIRTLYILYTDRSFRYTQTEKRVLLTLSPSCGLDAPDEPHRYQLLWTKYSVPNYST